VRLFGSGSSSVSWAPVVLVHELLYGAMFHCNKIFCYSVRQVD
jgi:hypothetical protein